MNQNALSNKVAKLSFHSLFNKVVVILFCLMTFVQLGTPEYST